MSYQRLRISQEVEIVPGCVVSVARPACPDNSPVSPGPGGVIRNMMGWSLEEKTEGSGVWLLGDSSLFEVGDWVKKGRTTQRGRSLVIPRVLVRMRTGKGRYRATHWTAVLATACLCVEGHRTPDEPLVC